MASSNCQIKRWSLIAAVPRKVVNRAGSTGAGDSAYVVRYGTITARFDEEHGEPYQTCVADNDRDKLAATNSVETFCSQV